MNTTDSYQKKPLNQPRARSTAMYLINEALARARMRWAQDYDVERRSARRIAMRARQNTREYLSR